MSGGTAFSAWTKFCWLLDHALPKRQFWLMPRTIIGALDDENIVDRDCATRGRCDRLILHPEAKTTE